MVGSMVRDKVKLGWKDVLILTIALKAAEEVKPSQQAKREVFNKFGVSGSEKDPVLTSIFYRVLKKQGVLDKVIRDATGIVDPLLLDPYLRSALRLFIELEIFSRGWVILENPYQVRKRLSALLSKKSHPYVGMWFFNISWGLRKYSPKPTSLGESLELKYLLPSWYIERMIKLIGRREAEKYFETLNSKPKLSVRVNVLKSTAEEIINELHASGAKEIIVSKVVPTLIKFKGPFNFNVFKPFKEGKIIIQEESAALAPILLNPRPGDFVVDLASAPGGKTELMGELMRNEGIINAYDINEKRVERMRTLLRRAGIKNVVIQVKDGRTAPADLGKGVADKVLVDAPCSSDGTIMKNQDLRWRLMENEVSKFAQIQYELLKAGIKLLRPGGELLYSTCSMLKEEDEDVINYLLEKEGRKIDLIKLEGPYDPGFLKGTMRAWPHKHSTIGFFYVKLRRLK